MRDENFIEDFKNHLKVYSIEEIIDDLPPMLKRSCNYLVEKTEKEVFLIGALGVISGLLPNIKGMYAGKDISPNLYVYLLGGYGGGKGSLDYARQLGYAVHNDKRNKTKVLRTEYFKLLEVYRKELREFNKGKSPGIDPPIKPVIPPESMLYIPANNSKSGIYQLLEENYGKGILFESEGDTLADAMGQDFGNFSDTLRKAFHHENLDLFRKTNNEHIEIENPELSVVLSSTPNQLKSLIPTIENGLYSRFLFYWLKQDNRFNDVFDIRKNNYKQLFNSESLNLKILYDKLEENETPIYINLTNEQEYEFLIAFRKLKAKLIEEVGENMAGTGNRLALITFRIIMIFSTLRAYEKGTLNNSVTCSNIDFDNALRIVERLQKHAISVHDFLESPIDKKQLALNMRKSGVSIPDISRSLGKNRGTISKWCKDLNLQENGNPRNPSLNTDIQ